jgi:hypothetical protein
LVVAEGRQWRFWAENPESTFDMYLESGMWILGWRCQKRGSFPDEWRFWPKNPESTFRFAVRKWILGWRP